MNTKIIKTPLLTPDLNGGITDGANIIQNGGLVVFPTETVYGLGADGTNAEAAKKIYQAKGRPSDNPLIIHIAFPKDAEKFAYTNSTYEKLALAFMPGPLTVVLKAKNTVPKETRGGLSTVAIRCPSHPVAHALIAEAGVPIAAPSANLSGSPSPTNATHVIDDMLGRVDMILDGGSSDFGLESTIVKVEEDESVTLLRPGRITVEDLEQIGLQVKIAEAVTAKLKEGEVALSPGMKYRHYAPKAPVFLLDGTIDEVVAYIKQQPYKNITVFTYDEDKCIIAKNLPSAHLYDYGKREDELFQAHILFYLLREADKCDYDAIYAPLPSKEGIGLALYNRLIRAAAYQIINLSK